MKLNLKQLLREAELNDYAKKFVDTFSQVPEGEDAHPEAVKHTSHLPFNEHHQYIIPVSNTQGDVHKVLTDNGFTKPDYVAGTALDKHGRAGKITRILAKHAPHLVEPFNTRDKNKWGENQLRGNDSGESPYDIVISRHKYDIGGMSTQKKWESCQTIRSGNVEQEQAHPFGYNLRVHGDIQSGSLVSYVMPKEHASNRPDPTSKIDVDHSIARMTLKPYYEATDGAPDRYGNPQATKVEGGRKIYRPSKLYGERNEAVRNDLTNWTKTTFPSEEGKYYKEEDKVYQDGEDHHILGPAPKDYEPSLENKAYSMRLLDSYETHADTALKIMKTFPEEGAHRLSRWMSHPDEKVKNKFLDFATEQAKTHLDENGMMKRETSQNRMLNNNMRTLASHLVYHGTTEDHVTTGIKMNPEYADNLYYQKPKGLTDEGAKNIQQHFMNRLATAETDPKDPYHEQRHQLSAGFRYMNNYTKKHNIAGALDGAEKIEAPTVQGVVAGHGTSEQKVAISSHKNLAYDTALTLLNGHRSDEEGKKRQDTILNNILHTQKPEPGDENKPSSRGYSNLHDEKHSVMYNYVRYAGDYVHGEYGKQGSIVQKLYDKVHDQFDKNNHQYVDGVLHTLAGRSTNPAHKAEILNLPAKRKNGDSNMYTIRQAFPGNTYGGKGSDDKDIVHVLRRVQNEPDFAKEADREGLHETLAYAVRKGSPLIPYITKHVSDVYTYDNLASKTDGNDKLATATIHAAKDPVRMARSMMGYHRIDSDAYKFAQSLQTWGETERTRRDWIRHKNRQLDKGPQNDPAYYQNESLSRYILESRFGLSSTHRDFIDNHTDDTEVTSHFPQSEHDLYNATQYLSDYMRTNVHQAREMATNRTWKTTGADKKVMEYTKDIPFNQHHQLIIPLDSERGEVEKHLGDQGWHIHDYDQGLAGRHITLKDGPMKGEQKLQTKNISRLIKDPKLLERFNTRLKLGSYDNAGEGHSIVVSRHKYDIGGMSTNKNWSSCQNLDDYDTNHEKDIDDGNLHIQHEMNAGTHVAYLMSNENVDHTGTKAVDTDHALARIALRPYFPVTAKENSWGGTDFQPDRKAKPAFPLSRVYSDTDRDGTGAETFKAELKAKYLDKYHPMADNTTYQMHPKVYPDIDEQQSGKITPDVDPKNIPEYLARRIINNPKEHKLTEPSIMKFNEAYPNLTPDIIRHRLTEAPNFQQKLWDGFKANPKGTPAAARDALAYSLKDKDKLDFVAKNITNYSHYQHLTSNPNATLEHSVQGYKTYNSLTDPDGQYDRDYYKNHAAHRLIEKAGALKGTDPKGAKAVFDQFVDHPSPQVQRSVAQNGMDEHLDKLMSSPDTAVRSAVLAHNRPQDVKRSFEQYDNRQWQNQLEHAGYYHGHTGAKQSTFDEGFKALMNPNRQIPERNRISHLYTLATFTKNKEHLDTLSKVPNVTIAAGILSNGQNILDDSHFKNILRDSSPPASKPGPAQDSNEDMFTDKYGRRKHFGERPVDHGKRAGSEYDEMLWTQGGNGMAVRQNIINSGRASIETLAHLAKHEPTSQIRATLGALAIGKSGTLDDTHKLILQHALVSNKHFTPEDRRSLPWHVSSEIRSGEEYLKHFTPEVQEGYANIVKQRNVRDRLQAVYAHRDLQAKGMIGSGNVDTTS